MDLVSRQGGQFWVKRRPQKCSPFSFTLPVVSLDAAITPAPPLLEESITSQVILPGVYI
jgi:hypothetical protein